MRQIFVSLGKALHKSLLFSFLIGLISLSTVFMSVQQPSYAAKTTTLNAIEEKSGGAGDPVQAYDQAIEEAKSPHGLEKAYEENLKEYKQENPEPGIVEKAEELIEKVTGKD